MVTDDLNIVRNPNARHSNEPVDISAKKWDKAGFRALRDSLKQPGVITIKPWVDAPEFEVTLDLSGIGALVLTGKLSNKMIAEKRKAISDVGENLKEVGTKVDNNEELAGDESVTDALNNATIAVLDYHDYILSAVVSDPKYYMMDEVKKMNTLHPDDGLSVFDFDAELRWAIVKVLNEGAEEYRKFRADPIGYSIALSEQSLRDATGGDVSTTDNAVVDQTMVQSGDLASGDSGRSRTESENGGSMGQEEKPIETPAVVGKRAK